ncbi:hypothetical protein ACS0TY_004654 [Phlomoides rotata]
MLLVAALEVNCVEEHQVYLRIPTHMGRAKSNVFRGLVGRIEKKLKDWKARTLSQTGKLTLLKSVIQSIPTYLMSVFRIPQRVVR